MNHVDQIFATFGGARRLAAELGFAPSTVRSWASRGSIPDDQKALVMLAARRLGLPLFGANFFPDQALVADELRVLGYSPKTTRTEAKDAA